MINGLMVYMIQQRMENYLINMDIIIHIESLYLGSKYLPRVLVIGLMILLYLVLDIETVFDNSYSLLI